MHAKYYLLNVEITDYNVMIDEQNLFNKPVKNNLKTYKNIRKVATGQGDDYMGSCLFDYNCLKKYYQMTAIDLSKQQSLDADLKEI